MQLSGEFNDINKWNDNNDFFSNPTQDDMKNHINNCGSPEGTSASQNGQSPLLARTTYMNDILKNDIYEFDNSYISAQGEINGTPISDIKKTINNNSTIKKNNVPIEKYLPNDIIEKNNNVKIENHYFYIKSFIHDIYSNLSNDTSYDSLSISNENINLTYNHIKKCKFCKKKIRNILLEIQKNNNIHLLNNSVKPHSCTSNTPKGSGNDFSEKCMDRDLIENFNQNDSDIDNNDDNNDDNNFFYLKKDFNDIIIIIISGILVIFLMDIFVKLLKIM